MLCLLSSGSNAQGQLGNGTLEDAHIFRPCLFESQSTLLGGVERVIKVAAGANHTLLLLEFVDHTREIWGCGDGRKGQLGHDTFPDDIPRCTTKFRKIRLSLHGAGLEGYQFKSIEATWETSYAVLEREGSSDVLISFGSDEYGDLGIGGKVEKGRDFHVVRFDHILPSGEVLNIDSISSGQRHVAVRVQTSSSSLLVGWGICRHGQLGPAGGENFSSLPRVILLGPSTSYALGIQHTVVCRDPNLVTGLGSNRKGQLQVAETFAANSMDATVKDIGCTWNGSYLLLQAQGKWEVRSSGSNTHSQLGRASTTVNDVGIVEFPNDLDLDYSKTSLSIACGTEHVLVHVSSSCSLSSSSGEVWGWGWNEHGNLGLGHTEDVPRPVRLWSQSNDERCVDVCGIWAGSGTSWVCIRLKNE